MSGELDARAASHWDTFYQQNKTKFFKDRHYLHREFPELATGDCTILEVQFVALASHIPRRLRLPVINAATK